MQPPIFVDAKSEMLVYDSLEYAESDLEPIDVQNEEYESAYDSEGRLIAITTDGTNVKFLLLESEPAHASELEEKLRAFLIRINEAAAESPTCDLPCLVEYSRQYIIH